MAEHEATRPGAEEVAYLLTTLTGPVTAMVAGLTDGAVRVVTALIGQAYDAGVAAGSAGGDRVTQLVGTRHEEAGVPGVLVRCDLCGGQGLLHQPDPPPPADPPPPGGDASATTVIPRVAGDVAETAVIPRFGGPPQQRR